MSLKSDSRVASSLLRWLLEAGADEAIEDTPSNRLRQEASRTMAPEPDSRPRVGRVDMSEVRAGSGKFEAILKEGRRAALASPTLEKLRVAVEKFDGCALKGTATNTVFSDGNSRADLMLIGEAPGAEEDRTGVPFVGAAGQLLDLMLAAIDRDRSSTYISNILFWRPPGNRSPTSEEVSLCLPFVARHIALVRPRVLVLVGGIAAKTLLARKEGITRLRGKWYRYCPDNDSDGIDTTAIFHPAFLLRKAAQKRETWRDLIAIRTRLAENETRR